MNCVHCGTEDHKLEKVTKVSDEVNKFGRREIVYQAESTDYIEYKNGLYHCKKCGKSFTFQEAISGAPIIKKQNPFERMFNVTSS